MARPAPPARSRSCGQCRRACRGRSEPSGLSWQAPLLGAWHGGPRRRPSTPEAQASPTAVARSTGHVLELREVERSYPLHAALHEHLELRLDQLGTIEASQLDEDKARKALQIAGIEPRRAFGAEIPIKSFAGISYIVKCLWRAAQ